MSSRQRPILSLVVLAASALLPSTGGAQPVLAPGDLVAASRGYGSLLAVSRTSGQVSLLSGPDLSSSTRPIRGTGPGLAASHLVVLPLSATDILARPAANGSLYDVAAESGNRVGIPGDAALLTSGGAMIRVDRDTLLTLGDDFNAGLQGNGRLLRYSISRAQTTLLSGGTRGDGPAMHRPHSLALIDDHVAAVCEFGYVNTLPGCILYLVDLATGNRSVLSTPGEAVSSRYMVSGGVVSSGLVSVPPRGAGPVVDGQVRGLAFLQGRLFISGVLAGTFETSIMEVDLATGDRTLLGGTAYGPGHARVTVPFPAGSTTQIPDGPSPLLPYTDHSLIMGAVFGPNRVWEFDINTHALSILADLDTFVTSVNRTGAQFSGLGIVPEPCSIPPYRPQFVTQPSDLTLCGSDAGDLWAGVMVVNPVSFQWQIEAPGAPGDWISIGADPLPLACGGWVSCTPFDAALTSVRLSPCPGVRSVRMRCVATDPCGTSTSEPATVTALSAIDPVCVGCDIDMNRDGNADQDDVGYLINAAAGGGNPTGIDPDFNRDGNVDQDDVSTLITTIAGGPCP